MNIDDYKPSPYKKIYDYVLSTTKSFDEWVTVKANVKEDFKKLHKLDVKKLDGVAIMVDTDNSKWKRLVIIKIFFFLWIIYLNIF